MNVFNIISEKANTGEINQSNFEVQPTDTHNNTHDSNNSSSNVFPSSNDQLDTEIINPSNETLINFEQSHNTDKHVNSDNNSEIDKTLENTVSPHDEPTDNGKVNQTVVSKPHLAMEENNKISENQSINVEETRILIVIPPSPENEHLETDEPESNPTNNDEAVYITEENDVKLFNFLDSLGFPNIFNHFKCKLIVNNCL